MVQTVRTEVQEGFDGSMRDGLTVGLVDDAGYWMDDTVGG